MISDEQIKQALEAAGVEFQYFTHARTNAQMCTTEGSISFDLIANGVRALIALAQEVKPLEFKQDEDGDYCAKTILGEYWIYAGKMFIFRRLELKTLEEAIEAANADFRKRVLSCLVNGGV